MALFLLVFLGVAFVLIGIGIVLGLVGVALTALLVGMGVISSSFAIGLRTGRPAAGIRAFLLQMGIVAGLPAGAVCAWLAHSFFATYGSGWPILVYGAIGGGLAGALLALLFDRVVRRFHLWASSRVKVMDTASERAQRRPVFGRKS